MRAELLWFLCGNFKIFVTMATGVGLTQISLTQLNRQTPKTACLVQESWWYLIHQLSYSRFSDKIYQFLPARRYASAGHRDRNVSVHLSRAGIVSKRRKLAAWFLHHLVAPRLWFSDAKFHHQILRVSPRTDASNKGPSGKFSDFLALSVNISKTVADTAQVTISD